jgi:hypothetical protein
MEGSYIFLEQNGSLQGPYAVIPREHGAEDTAPKSREVR